MISLHTAGLLTRSTETADIGGFKRTWEVHRLTRAGEDWLAKDEAARAPVMLPMPQVMIDAQREKKRRAAETVAELVSAGVQMDQVPAEEVEDGGGEVMTVLTMWVRTLQRLRSPETSSQGVFLTQPCSSAPVFAPAGRRDGLAPLQSMFRPCSAVPLSESPLCISPLPRALLPVPPCFVGLVFFHTGTRVRAHERECALMASSHLRSCFHLPWRGGAGSIERADHLEAVLQEVRQWRDGKAKALRIAPAAVLPDYLAMKIIHARATDKDALVAVSDCVILSPSLSLSLSLSLWQCATIRLP